ncbi:hypothetical protein RQP46_006997 [Phenoliferia psychrophenolica]
MPSFLTILRNAPPSEEAGVNPFTNSYPPRAAFSQRVKPGTPASTRLPEQHSLFGPELRPERRFWIVETLTGTCTIILMIFIVLPIFWGAIYQRPQHVPSLNGAIVNFDGGMTGKVVEQVFSMLSGQPGNLTWSVLDATKFSGPEEVANLVIEGEYWAAVVVNEGASSNYMQAVKAVDAMYDPTSAITAFGAQARNERAFGMQVLMAVQLPLIMISVKFAAMNAGMNLAGLPNLATIMKTAPMLVTRPIFFQLKNIRPLDESVGVAMTLVGLIILAIMTFYVVIVNYNARLAYYTRLSYASNVSARVLPLVWTYFFASLCYCLVSLAFQVDFTKYFGHAGFVIYWMSTYLGMLAIGFTMETVAAVLSPPRTVPFMLFFIVVNLSTIFFPIDLTNNVYRYGYAMPFHSMDKTVRTVVFGVGNNIGRDFGVLIAWIVLGFVQICAVTYFVGRSEERKMAYNAKHGEASFEDLQVTA